jgi:hypothetical protein
MRHTMLIRLIAAIGASLVLVGAAVAASAIQTGKYTGFTSQHPGHSGRVTLNVAKAGAHGLKVRSLALDWYAKCATGKHYAATTTVTNVAISNGKFHAQGSFSEPVGTTTLTGNFAVKLTGHFPSARKSAGTWSMDVVVTDQSGAVIDTCRTGALTWSAKH